LRVALIADTHLPRGDRELPSRCVEEIAAADLLLHAGDIRTEETLAWLRTLGPPVQAVRGNVDSPQLAKSLPEEVSVELEGVVVSMLHDAGPAKGRLARMHNRFPESDVVLFGHSHMPVHEERDGFQIFNPGSPTERRRAPTHTMGIAEIGNGEIELRHLEV
jgi:putative phosphoesterase